MKQKIIAAAAWLTVSAAGWSAESVAYQEAMREANRLGKRLRHAEAAQCCDRARELAATATETLAAQLELALNLVKSGRSTAGRAGLEHLLEQGMDKPDQRAAAFEGIGDSQAHEREFESARQAYAQMLKVDGANSMYTVRGWTKIGRVEYALERYQQARDAYEKALSVPRTGAFHLKDAWPGIGDCYRAAGRYAEARQAYERVLQARNADASTKQRAAAAIAHSYYEEGDYPAAAAAYQAVLRKGRRPDTWRAVERLDMICRSQLRRADELLTAGRIREARDEYDRMVSMVYAEKHHKAAALLGVGNCLAAERKYAEARAQYANVLTTKGARWPDRGRAQLGIARAYEAEGKAGEAGSAYEQVLNMTNVSRFDAAEARRHLK